MASDSGLRDPRPTESDLHDCAREVSATLDATLTLLEKWRQAVADLGESPRASAVDELVSGLVMPLLGAERPGVTGAGFISADGHVRGRGTHFAWWLAPFEGGPVFGTSTEPTRLDLSTRGYVDYVRDVHALEWYAAPSSTRSSHVTGPYVDHLCTCDYILTITQPVQVGQRLVGVVGVDIAVRELENHLLAQFLRCPHPLALINSSGRVVISTEPTVQSGSLLAQDAGRQRLDCEGTPFTLVAL